MKQQVLDCFAKLFGGEGDIRTYFAPGRVNLIGGQTSAQFPGASARKRSRARSGRAVRN